MKTKFTPIGRKGVSSLKKKIIYMLHNEKIRNIFISVVNFLARIFLRPVIIGEENLARFMKLKKENGLGAFIISNHINALDPVLIRCLKLYKEIEKDFPIAFFSKRELFNRPWKQLVLENIGAIPVHNGDIKNIRDAIDKIKRGDILFLFQSFVSLNGSLGEVLEKTKKEGKIDSIGFFARHVSFILLPIRIKGIAGWRQDWKNILLFRRTLRIHFGVPFVVKQGTMINAIEIIKGIDNNKCASAKSKKDEVL